MISVEYNYYTNVFKGTVIPNETAFNSSVIEAVAYIEYITRGKVNDLATVPDAVKNAVCAVCEVIHREKETDTDKTVTSESVGNHSISYANNAKKPSEREREKAKKATLYLSRTGLLYGGMA